MYESEFFVRFCNYNSYPKNKIISEPLHWKKVYYNHFSDFFIDSYAIIFYLNNMQWCYQW